MGQSADSLIHLMRSCTERAERARGLGDSESYRRLIEEYLFLSIAAARQIGGDSGAPKPIPHVVIFHENEAIATILRESLIEARYAAHIEAAGSLDLLSQRLDLLDASRPAMIIVCSQLTFSSGLGAINRIKKHPRAAHLPILVLTHCDEDHEDLLAMAAGAMSCARFPESFAGFAGLGERMRAMLAEGGLPSAVVLQQPAKPGG